MNGLTRWIDSPLAEALGWALIHSLWQGTLLAAALGVTLLISRSARLRYTVACAALLLLPCAFFATLAGMLMNSGDSATGAFWRPPLLLSWAAAGATTNTFRPSIAARLAALVPWLAPLWILGVLIASGWQAAGWLALFRLRRRGVCSPPAEWTIRLDRLRARLRISRPVLLLESCLAETPVVMGHFRPLILIPLGLLEKLPIVQIEAILLHELAHIRRCDYLVNTLQRIVEGLFFYHPAAWWISRLIRIEREHCCDDLVVATQHNAQQYAAALAALEETRWSRDTAATVSATGGSLVNRIQRLLHPHRAGAQRPQTWTPLLAALVLLITAVAAVAASQQPAPSSPSAGATSPYLNWLNQDVAYIIADEERAGFTRLTTDPERERFIEQFWLRRDPTPGTPNNEFKVEHYRRISYANQRFPTRTQPGWQTDRGRLYIVYGPPDEIESHPSGSANLRFPYEIWLYRHVEGIGNNLFLQFVDKTGSGDYRSAPSPSPLPR